MLKTRLNGLLLQWAQFRKSPIALDHIQNFSRRRHSVNVTNTGAQIWAPDARMSANARSSGQLENHSRNARTTPSEGCELGHYPAAFQRREAVEDAGHRSGQCRSERIQLPDRRLPDPF